MLGVLQKEDELQKKKDQIENGWLELVMKSKEEHDKKRKAE